MQALLDDLGQADSMYKSMYESSKNSAGSAMDENEKYMKSLEARIALARVEVEKLALAFGDAFLTEGMITGLKVFSEFLNGLAQLTEQFGALPIVLGTASVGLALLSTRFRALMISIGETAGSLGRMAISTATVSRAAITATVPLITQTTATNALATSTVLASTNMEKMGVSTAVTTTAARALNAPMTDLGISTQATGKAASKASVSMASASTATATAGTSAKAAATGFWAASAGIRGMLLSAGLIGGAFVALGAVTEALISKQTEQRELQEKIDSENKQLADSYLQNQDSISKLVDRYAELQTAIDNGSYDNETVTEYADIQNEIAELLPSLKQGETDLGDAILGNAGIIKQRVDLLKEQVEAQERANIAAEKAEQIEAYNLAKEAKEEAQKNLDGFDFSSNDSAYKDKRMNQNTYLDVGEVKNAQDLDNALALLQERKAQMIEEDAEANRIKINLIDGEIASYQKQRQSYLDLQMAVELADNAIVSSAIKKSTALVNENNKMNSSSKNLVEQIQLSTVNAVEDSDKMAGVLDRFYGMLENPVSTKGLEDYGKALETLKQKQADGLSTDELQKYESDVLRHLDVVEDEFMNLAELEGITPELDSEAYNRLASIFATLRPQIGQTAMSADDLSSSLGITIQEAEMMIAAAAGLDGEMGMLDDSMAEASNEAYVLKDAIDMLSGVTEQYLMDTDELLWMHQIMEERLAGLTVGTQEYDIAEQNLKSTKEQLIALYPHLFANDATAVALTGDKIGAIAEEVRANDILRAAYSASRDGKLTSEQEATLANLANTNARIKNINAEIIALNKLAAAYRQFAENSIKTAELYRDPAIYKDGAMEHEAREAEIRARKFSGFARTQETASASLTAELANETAMRTKHTDILAKIPEVLDRGTTSANKNASAARKEAEANDKAAKAKDKAAKSTKDKKKAEEDAYETTTENNEAVEKAIYLADKYKQALEKLTLIIQKQESITSRMPDYSKAYRKSLSEEIKLQEKKKRILQDQAKSIESQIKNGKIVEYGTRTVEIAGATTTTKTTKKLSGWDGRFTSGYGMRTNPVTGQYKLHAGNDLASPRGTRLDANVGGKVLFAGSKGNGFGNYVQVLDKDGMKHIYAHLDSVAVKIGQTVSAGMKLGAIGSTGNSTGSHLHYEVRNSKGQPINSINYLNDAKKGKVVASTTTGKPTTKEVKYKDEAATQQAIDDAKSNLLGIQSDIISANEAIRQLRMDAIQSAVGEFKRTQDYYDRLMAKQDFISSERARKAGADENSSVWRSAQWESLDLQGRKIKSMQEESYYLDRQIRLRKDLTNAQREELRVQKADLYVQILEERARKLEMLHAIRESGVNQHIEAANKRSKALNRELEQLQYRANFLDDDEKYSKDLIKNLQDQFKANNKLKEVHMKNIRELEKEKRVVKDFPDLVKQIQEEIDNWKDSYKELQTTSYELEQSIEDIYESIADNIVNQMKEAYEKQREIALKAIEDEREAYRKLIDDKIKMMDEQAAKEDFLENRNEKQGDIQEMQERIDLLALDDSQFAKAERSKLLKELEEMQKEYDKFIRDKEREDRKKSLEEEMENKEKELEDKEKSTEDHFENLIEDERRWAKVRENILKGNVQAYINEFENMRTWLGDHMKDIGKSITTNMIDKLKEAQVLLASIRGVSSGTQYKGGETPAYRGENGKEDRKGKQTDKPDKVLIKQDTFVLKKEGDQYVPTDQILKKGTTWKSYGSRSNDGVYLVGNGYVTSDPKYTQYQYFKSGGYTGDNVPNEGALAVLHKKELVLKESDTSNLFKTIDLMNKLHSKMKSFVPPSMNQKNSNEPISIDKLVHIENFNGTKAEQDKLATTLIKGLSKLGVNYQ